MIAVAPKDADIHDTASMTLDEIIQVMQEAADKNFDVARVHSGDPSLYGAIGEQMRRLKELGIAFDITPGVPAYAAAAAARQNLPYPASAKRLSNAYRNES